MTNLPYRPCGFSVSLSHLRSTQFLSKQYPLSFDILSLRPLTLCPYISLFSTLTYRLQISAAMPNLKLVTKELRQEIVSNLIPFPLISSSLAFRLATLIFAKDSLRRRANARNDRCPLSLDGCSNFKFVFKNPSNY